MNPSQNVGSVDALALQFPNLRHLPECPKEPTDQFNKLKPIPLSTAELDLKGKVFLPSNVKSEKVKIGVLISEYWTQKKPLAELKKEFNEAHDALTKKNKDDIKLSCKAIQASLWIAAISNEEIEKSWVNYAVDCTETVKGQNYFNGISHYCDYMITRYLGIDCRKLFIVKEALHQLRRCIELEQSIVAKKKLGELLQGIKAAWNELEQIGEIDSKAHQKYLLELEYFLSDDPFKCDFIKNPGLFNLVKEAPEDFKAKHPHLLSREKFLEKHPEKKPLQPKQSNLGILVSEYSQPATNEETNDFIRIQDALVKNPKDLKLIADSFWPGLKMPMVSTCERGVGGIYYAINCKEILKKANYFSGLPHHFEYTITRYNQIDCQNLELVEQAIHQIKRSLELDPSSNRAKKDLVQLEEDLKKAWFELAQAGTIKSGTHQKFLTHLEIFLREDPFKEEFEKNPGLFNTVKNAPEEFKRKYPHLLSMDNFIKKYPESFPQHQHKPILPPDASSKINRDSAKENSTPSLNQNKKIEMLITSNKISITPSIFSNMKIFTDFPESTFTGTIPCALNGVFEENGKRGVMFDFINTKTNISLEDIISKSLKLSCITYDKGIPKTLSVLGFWKEWMREGKVSELALAVFPGGKLRIVEEMVDLKVMSDENYRELCQKVRDLIKA